MTSEAGDVRPLVDDLFRTQAGLLTARLARIFGPGGLADAEEVAQAALLKALAVWPFQGVPDNPEGWLWRVARNMALDRLRARRFIAPIAPEDIADALPAEAVETPAFLAELEDDRLRLVFACCHPVLAREAQLALTLKTVCGLGTAEIAAAFLVPEATLAQRLVRAKAKLAEARVPFAIPGPDELPDRLAAVLEVVYLTFNEGYEAARGEGLIRRELTDEALRLSRLLADHPVAGRPESRALAALLHLLAARLPARADAHGNLVLLAEQDRALWDGRLIAEGFRWLRLSLAGEVETRWHLEAAIAAAHAQAPAWAETDWPQILSLYDRLLARHPSPVVALNRAVALAEAAGAEAGLEALEALRDEAPLARYPLYAAARAEMNRRLGNRAAAVDLLRAALGLDLAAPMRRLLERRLLEPAPDGG